MTYMQPTSTEAEQPLRLGPNHGYRIAGDLACLNAELALAGAPKSELVQNWALQLWACDQPYAGGALCGTKIAEAPVELHDSSDAVQPQQLYAETFARLPAGDREYAMVLVLASRADGVHEQIRDFANYPAREHFHVPALRGEVSYTLEPGQVTLRAERIENPRGVENLSGTLALELWALDEPYQGGQFSGIPLAGVELGSLAGQASWSAIEHRLAAPVPERSGRTERLTLMLREWTATGYVTRDYRNFTREAAEPLQPSATSAMPAPAAAAPAPMQEVPAAQVARPAQAARVSAPTAPTPAPSTAATPVTHTAQAEAPASGLVSIQHATLAELVGVPGLNRKLAHEIVKARPFRAFEDLTRVRGIGDKTLRKLRAVLTL